MSNNNNYIYKKRDKKGKTIIVKDNNVERAIRQLRRLVKELKILKTYNSNQYFIKDSYKRKKKKARKLFLSRLSNLIFELKNRW